MIHILGVEDEPDIQELLCAYLKDAGYLPVAAGDGTRAMALFHSRPFDLILLDILLPGMDGYQVCSQIRRQSQVPVLFLSALDEEAAMLRGLRLDADDYVAKPFSMPLLLEKIRVILRRTRKTPAECSLHYQDMTLNPETREVSIKGRLLELTAREFDLLHLLLSSPGRVFTREMLLSLLWGYDFFGDMRVVDSHIKNLRRKLGYHYIETVRGVGYRAAKEIK